jgi:hypothetical protein
MHKLILLNQVSDHPSFKSTARKAGFMIIIILMCVSGSVYMYLDLSYRL